MSRLIDADELLIDMGAGCIPIDEAGISNITGDTLSISDYIKGAETAYDVDKVVARLEEMKIYLLNNFVLGDTANEVKLKAIDRINTIDGCIEIVKAGGKNEHTK